MKKLIILCFGLVLLLMATFATAQISGNDQMPKTDTTVRKFPLNTIPHRRDTLLKRKETARETEQRKHRVERKVDSAARAVGRKGAELGAKAGAAIHDRSLEDVKGPKGEKVYVDKYDRRYYINKEGKKVYLKKPQSK